MQTLTHVLKLCSVMLVGFAFVDRIIRAFPMQPDQSFLRLFLPQDFFQFLGIFHMARLICNSLRAFILPRLAQTEAIEILKKTAYTISTMFLIDCTWVGALITLQGLF